MNWDQMLTKWSRVKGELRRNWGKLTHDEWEAIAGSKAKLAGRLQVRYGIAKEGAEDQVEWLKAVPLPDPDRPVPRIGHDSGTAPRD
jgi:uncharacterized protein YjbJ (UPF0337 family)